MSNQQTTPHGQIAVRQLFSYALIGMLSNVAGYSVYLVLTYLGTTPKLTMTVLYAVGAFVGFFGNRKFTFRHRGHLATAGIRYLLAHMLGYLLNLSLLIVFVDRFGYAHQLVQACAIAIVAVFLFITFRVFVFPDGGPRRDYGVAKR
ncbi:GtrA family protein [uncultured Porticoccus sp.]|uniref:GtrA family protein n=1 Tax=uncultured Porticoccus sp. TaxID=1256050 RepID=UPI0026131C4A|nr:GtrA family protein [uncultured Porticoccus sp.]